MNKLRTIALGAIISLSAALTAWAGVKDLPIKTVNGRQFYYYEVPSKESVYSLCSKLGVTKAEIIENNPSVADGLKVGMTLLFPVDGLTPAQIASQQKQVTHRVERGETIFGLSKKYGVTTQELMKLNPSLANGLKAGQEIVIVEGVEPVEEPKAEAKEADGMDYKSPFGDDVKMVGYVVQKGDGFYSIAVENGITVAELEAANPGVTSLKTGQVLNIPTRVKAPEAQATISVDEFAAASGVQPSEETTEPQEATEEAAKAPSVNIAVLLPFMLNEETPSKSAERFTEFYKGFLLGVDSLRKSEAPIHITAFDTEGSTIKVREILDNPDFKGFDAIIASDNPAQLAILAEYGKNNDAKVFNTFLVRDDSYQSNPAVMQANLPSALMYDKAIEGLLTRLTYSSPVFLTLNGAAADKADFVNTLKQKLTESGKEFVDIAIEGKLAPEDLEQLPADGNYYFLTPSSRPADLNKLMPGILEWRDIKVTPSVHLFGYPEWITFRGETLDNMHNLNTTVYSRFYEDEDSWRSRSLENKFKRWYGTKMEGAVPRQGSLGFDTAMFLIGNVLKGSSKYDGVQNGYNFVSVPDGGQYNSALYFINFRPAGVTDKTVL